MKMKVIVKLFTAVPRKPEMILRDLANDCIVDLSQLMSFLITSPPNCESCLWRPAW